MALRLGFKIFMVFLQPMNCHDILRGCVSYDFAWHCLVVTEFLFFISMVCLWFCSASVADIDNQGSLSHTRLGHSQASISRFVTMVRARDNQFSLLHTLKANECLMSFTVYYTPTHCYHSYSHSEIGQYYFGKIISKIIGCHFCYHIK